MTILRQKYFAVPNSTPQICEVYEKNVAERKHNTFIKLKNEKMKTKFTKSGLKLLVAGAVASVFSIVLMSSSHREAPMIADDPVADNTDLYAFRDPNNATRIVIIANFIPGQLPQAGPYYYPRAHSVRCYYRLLIHQGH